MRLTERLPQVGVVSFSFARLGLGLLGRRTSYGRFSRRLGLSTQAAGQFDVDLGELLFEQFNFALSGGQLRRQCLVGARYLLS
ncbi:hypothetical protein GTP91_23695 [Rugamonas sp. FT82W]|uniref:Uncharacterized protein n=1 Tax=Duganella vulcania TaxID=2692166 RepID=A0A845G648_9BURK|nr:hypothetical protein [Duganella vulcania]MYM90163.1 hypothetical protein [Duganella vulcania]